MQAHSFHIPVMGLGFSIDTPVKVAHYGISSVVSIVDDMLIEKMREVICKRYEIPYEPIPTTNEDYRAKRITAYLNLLDSQVRSKFEELKATILTRGEEIENYISMLPEISDLKQKFSELIEKNENVRDILEWLNEHLHIGSIDVNIMTKLDKANYSGNEQLPVEFNDAHAALRGFARSNLSSSIVLSAGLNPRLYGYFENFEDFFPDKNLNLKKKIILKVSDFRSAFIQGKFFAKKGLWVSEYRIESGLNCGGHAFASDGYLLGPILDEFKHKRKELVDTIFELWSKALERKGKFCCDKPLPIKVTAQGGVGTSEEHDFLIEHYELDSVGWGSPFLLVDEAATIDKDTQNLLKDATEDDFYLSHISPLGIRFNSVAGSSKEIEKMKLASEGKPGSPCPKKFLVSNVEFTEKPICTASRQYQDKKIKDIKLKYSDPTLSPEYKKVIEKSCLCVGLSTAALKVYDANDKLDGDTSVVCPGPNLAYFSKAVSLSEMIDHIYGRVNLITRKDRPNMFMKELKLYIEYFKEKLDEFDSPFDPKQQKFLDLFQKNMIDGIDYYKGLFQKFKSKFGKLHSTLLNDLEKLENEFSAIIKKL